MSSFFQTERLPSPVVMTGVVGKDLPARALTVRLSELESGYARLQWKTAHQALPRAEETVWRTAQTVWAGAPGSDRIAFAVSGDLQTLLLHFQPGEPAYRALVEKPG
jgi:hypothetical protein